MAETGLDKAELRGVFKALKGMDEAATAEARIQSGALADFARKEVIGTANGLKSQAVAGRMGLVESVVCKRLEGLEHLVDRGAGNPTLGCARNELLLQSGEDILFLLAYRVPQGVRLRA